jgi:hypothetical protein
MQPTALNFMAKKYLSSFAFKANVVYFGSVTSKIIRKVQCNISHTLKFRISNQRDQCIKKPWWQRQNKTLISQSNFMWTFAFNEYFIIFVERVFVDNYLVWYSNTPCIFSAKSHSFITNKHQYKFVNNSRVVN